MNNGVVNGMNNFNQMGNNLNPSFQRNSTFPTYFNPSSSQATATPTNNIIWVQGTEGAKAFQLNPNSVAILLDSEEENKMYIKISDNIGMCSLRIFDYKEVPVVNNKATINESLDLSEYVKRSELDDLVKELKEILANEHTISTTSVTDGTSSPKTKPDATVLAKF